MHKVLTTWNRTYGDIIHFKMLYNDVIVVSSYEAVRDVYIKMGTEFGNRPSDFRWNFLFNGNRVFTGNICAAYSAIKKNTLTSLRWFGSEHSKLEAITLEVGNCCSYNVNM